MHSKIIFATDAENKEQSYFQIFINHHFFLLIPFKLRIQSKQAKSDTQHAKTPVNINYFCILLICI